MFKQLVDCKQKRDQAGFTLVELIVVLAILAILALLVVPGVSGYVAQANEKTALSNASTLVDAAQLYAMEQGLIGKGVGGTLTEGTADFQSYYSKLPTGATFSLTLTPAGKGYATSGTYTHNKEISVDLATFVVTRSK